MVRGIWTSHFPSKSRSKFKAFSGTLSGTSFFDFLVHLGAKMLDFGTPLVPSWLQNGTQNHPSGAKMTPISQRRCRLLAALVPRTHSARSWAPFWSILGPLGTKLGPKWRPKSLNLRQKLEKKYQDGACWNRPFSKIVFGALLEPILIDFGWFLSEI